MHGSRALRLRSGVAGPLSGVLAVSEQKPLLDVFVDGCIVVLVVIWVVMFVKGLMWAGWL